MSAQNYTNIEKIIPHRSPMVMIQQYRRIDENASWACVHFSPDAYACCNGRVSEGMLIEAVAQTAAAHVGYEAVLDNEKKSGMGMLATVDEFFWHEAIKDDAKIEIRIIKIDEIGPFKIIKADINVGEKLAASGRIKLFNPPVEG